MTSAGGPFSTIESAQEFLALLAEEIDNALDEVRRELARHAGSGPSRRIEAWQLVLYATTKLSSHVASSRRIMNDLRTLRNLLHRTSADAARQPAQPPVDAPDGGRVPLARPREVR